MRRIVMVAAVSFLLAVASRAAAQQPARGTVRVLPASSGLDVPYVFLVRSTLLEMVERSSTFAELMSGLDSVPDVVVYVQMATLEGKGLRGTARFAVASSGVIVAQISVHRFPPEQVRARLRTLAHELAHAYEVACLPRRAMTSTLYDMLASRAARGGDHSLETPFAAAVEATVLEQWFRPPEPSRLKRLAHEHGLTGCHAADVPPMLAVGAGAVSPIR